MFYGAYVLAKKGPLAKVWLAAHWDKKLTKAHVFETDVSATVEDIISPKVRMALRTSGHLLLGVVRIYSRKQKYLIHDLGEACAKIRMAFRPGIVDLPSEGGVVSTDAITLPEIFHDFETAVADLGSLDMEQQFTINRSRMAEITIAEDLTGAGVGVNDPFSEFGEFGDEFGGGMEDIERARKAVTFEEEKDRTDRDSLQVTTDASTTLLPEDGRKEGMAMDDEQLPDRNDFGGGDFLEDLGGLGGLEGLGEVPSMGDITVEGVQREDTLPAKPGEEQAGEEPMEVDKQDQRQTADEQHDQTLDQSAQPPPPPPEDETGFVLEPVDVTLAVDTTTKSKKRKRRLVVDTEMEFKSKHIRSQLENYTDTLQPKLFPPPTKKAMLWKDMTTCEQLFLRPVFPFVSTEILRVVTRNYNSHVPDEPTEESLLLDLEQEEGQTEANATRDTTTGDVEKARVADPTEADSILATDNPTVNAETLLDGVGNDEVIGGVLGQDDREIELEGGVREQEEEGMVDEQASRVIPDMPELEGLSSEDAPSQLTSADADKQEMSEEFEKRRWTKRTQQVLKMLDRSLANSSQTPFSALTQKCSRKQAASRFYTCLLLAKENTIHVKQAKAYDEIFITKGPRFAKAF